MVETHFKFLIEWMKTSVICSAYSLSSSSLFPLLSLSFFLSFFLSFILSFSRSFVLCLSFFISFLLSFLALFLSRSSFLFLPFTPLIFACQFGRRGGRSAFASSLCRPSFSPLIFFFPVYCFRSHNFHFLSFFPPLWILCQDYLAFFCPSAFLTVSLYSFSINYNSLCFWVDIKLLILASFITAFRIATIG